MYAFLRHSRISIIICCILAILLGALLAWNHSEEIKLSSYLQEIADQKATDDEAKADALSFSLVADTASEEEDFLISAYDVLEGNASGEILIDSATFCESASNWSAYLSSKACVTYSYDGTLSEGEIAILQFTLSTTEDSGGGWFTLTIGDNTETLWISSTSTSYYIPIVGECTLNSITFSMDNTDFVKTSINELYLVKYTDYTINELRTGIYEDYDCTVTSISAEDAIIDGTSKQCLVNGDYLYVLGSGTLSVYLVKDNRYELLSSCTGMGSTCDMVFTSNQKGIVITARENGAYLIDISNPKSIQIASHYATLEKATGLCVSGDYAFLCSRYFGIEIIDISDLYHPYYVNQVGDSSEYQNCTVADGYLYVGVYGQYRVDIWDITDLANPILCSQTTLNGNAHGVCVVDGILYISEGRDSYSSTDLSSFGKGTGNGLEIYDVTDPYAPLHLATEKTLGRLSIGANDFWDVTVSSGYAYLSSRYNGIYVFDVTDPSQPNCVDIITIEATADSSLYETVDALEYAFPYDTESIARACVYQVCLQDGYFYAVTSNMGIYKITRDYAKLVDSTETSVFTISTTDQEIPSIDGCEVSLLSYETSIYAISTDTNYYYVACGDGGILVLDQDLTILQQYQSDYAVLDCKVANGYLYTAESEGGLGIWKITGNRLTRVTSYCHKANQCYSSIAVTSDGSCVMVQSASSYLLLDTSNLESITQIKKSSETVGAMYYRNLCSSESGYLCAYGKESQCWYAYSANSLLAIGEPENTVYSEGGGICMVGEYALAVSGGGYYYFTPGSEEKSDKIRLDGYTLSGKCFSNGTLLCVVTEYSGNIIILNIEDLDNPVFLAEFRIEGSIDIGIFDGDNLLLPCRNDGLLKIDLSGLFG